MRFARWLFKEGTADDRVLTEQLLQLQSYVAGKVVSMVLLVTLLWWTLSADGNEPALSVWSAAIILSNLNAWLFARRCLLSGVQPQQARHNVLRLMALRAGDGVLWGAFPWITLDTTTTGGSIMVVAVIGAIAGGATSLLSAVLPVYVAFVIPMMAGIASKLWSLGDPALNSLGVGVLLFFGAMYSQARNSARATREAIETRFELAASQKQLHEIERREAIARERQRLMQDMHDGLGSSLRTALWTVEKGQLDESAVADVLKGCIDDLKLAIDSLETAPADLLLLLASWRYRLEPRLESTGIRLHWEVVDVPALEWLDPKNALHILRILQEAFSNALKHAQANEVRVVTRVEADGVLLKLCDDGTGFDPERARQAGGKGLSNQTQRAEAIGARIAWESGPGGTCMQLWLPFRRTGASAA